MEIKDRREGEVDTRGDEIRDGERRTRGKYG